MPLRGLCRKVRIGSFQHFFLTIFQTTNLTPYHKNDPDNDGYSDWTEVTEADLDVFAKARAAYLDDPANAAAPEYEMMKSLSEPYAVRTKAVENGMNYQFAFTICVVTICKSDGDEVGKVIEIQGASDYGKPTPPKPQGRDTIP